MSLPWIKLRPMSNGQAIYERADGWWMHHIGPLSWHLHNEKGAPILGFTVPAPQTSILFVCANNMVLHAQFKELGDPQHIAWSPSNG